MKELLRIEWRKMRTYKVFLILSIFFVLGVFLLNYIVKSTFSNMMDNTSANVLVQSFNPFSFDLVWQTVSYISGYLLILPMLLLVTLMTNEYQFRTVRQNIIDGISRREFIQVKLMLVLLFSVTATLMVVVCALLFGSLSGTSFSWEGISHIGYFFLKSLTYLLFALLISVWVRKTGLSLALCIIYIQVESVGAQLLDIWSMKIKKDSGNDLGALGDYLPLNAADGLLSFPDTPLKSMAEAALPTNYSGLVLGLACFYILLFVFLAYRSFLRRDL